MKIFVTILFHFLIYIFRETLIQASNLYGDFERLRRAHLLDSATESIESAFYRIIVKF